MTRKDLFETLFPEVDLDTEACQFLKCSPNGCSKCIYNDYWNKPAILTKTAVKSILNSVYGYEATNVIKEFKYFDTDNMLMQYVGRGEGKAYVQHLELIEEGWTQLPPIHNNIDWTTLNEIMCDAIVNGFEVKILNGTIYYREKQ